MNVKDYLFDACVMMDLFLSFRERHQNATKLVDNLKTKNAVIYIPSHAYFEYASTAITHYKNDYDKLTLTNLNTNPSSVDMQVISLNKEYCLELLNVLRGKPIPDLKSADMIYFCIARKEDLPLVTEDKKLRSQCKKGGLLALSIEEAILHLAAQ